MNTTKLKSPKVLIPALAAVALLGIGTAVAVEVVDERRDEVPTDVRSALGEAALAEVGVDGAVVADVDENDDRDEEAAYEVEVRTPDGREYDVWFDADQNIVFSGVDPDSAAASPTADGAPLTGDDTNSDATDRDSRTVDGIRVDDSERPLAEDDVAEVAAAATKGIPGTVVEVETTVADADDTGAEARTAYEVEIRADDGTLHVVRLSEDLTVLAVLRED